MPTGKSGPSLGTGAQLSVGLGYGRKGSILTLSEYGSGFIHGLYFTVTTPSRNGNDIMIDYSASFQFLFGASLNSNPDLSGPGQTLGGGVGPLSASYNTNSFRAPKYKILAFGPSVGYNVTTSGTETHTTQLGYVFSPLFVGMLNLWNFKF
jgi:hypothetical protein